LIKERREERAKQKERKERIGSIKKIGKKFAEDEMEEMIGNKKKNMFLELL
jgi:hypothetical protein